MQSRIMTDILDYRKILLTAGPVFITVLAFQHCMAKRIYCNMPELIVGYQAKPSFTGFAGSSDTSKCRCLNQQLKCLLWNHPEDSRDMSKRPGVRRICIC